MTNSHCHDDTRPKLLIYHDRYSLENALPGESNVISLPAPRIPLGRKTGIRDSRPSIVMTISPEHGSNSISSAAMANPMASCDNRTRSSSLRNSSVTWAEWELDVIMVEDLIERARIYCDHRKRILLLEEKLGSGVHGSVFCCRQHYDIVGKNALKIHERVESFVRERDVYLRLRELQIKSVRGHAVPRLIDFDDDLLVIEMSVVTRPFVLDFGGAWLDRPPEYSDEVLDEWERDKEEQFEGNWPKAREILSELRRFGIYVADVNPGNIGFVESEEQ